MRSNVYGILSILLAGPLVATCTNELEPTGAVTVTIAKTADWPDTLAAAEIATLAVTVTGPHQEAIRSVTLEWATSDSSVVTLTSGPDPLQAIVDSRHTGTATIQVRVAQTGFAPVQFAAPVVVKQRGADSLLSVGDVDTIGLVLRIDPSSLSGTSVTWSSSDPSILGVTPLPTDSTRAIITGRTGGTAQVLAAVQSDLGHSTFQLPVQVIPLQIIEQPAWAPLVTLGDSAAFAVTVQDALGRPRTGLKVQWSSTNGAAFTVDSQGVVLAKSLGGGQLVASVGAAPFQVVEHRAPLQVVEKWSAVSAGGAHTCAITATDGTGYCWGNNGAGQLGLAVDASPFKTRPSRVVTFHKFTELQAGGSHSCGREGVDNLLCWGLRDRSQLGDGLCPPNASDFSIICAPSASVPVTIVDAGILNGQKVAVNQIAAGGTLTCIVNGLHIRASALDPIGLCWGNRNGPMGNPLPQFDSTAALAQAEPIVYETTVVTAGGSQACIYGRGFSGVFEVMCAGLNDAGQLGDGTTTDRSTWRDVLRFDAPILGIPQGLSPGASVGRKHACALLGDAVWCWGSNSSGQLGASAASTCGPADDLPVAIPCSLFAIPAQLPVSATSISAGGEHTCALTAAGDAWCWGSNSNGQLGNGTIGGSNQTPALVSGGLKFVSISAGGSHTCGVTPAGAIFCWGANASGQLGDGTQTDRPVPTRVTEAPQ